MNPTYGGGNALTQLEWSTSKLSVCPSYGGISTLAPVLRLQMWGCTHTKKVGAPKQIPLGYFQQRVRKKIP